MYQRLVPSGWRLEQSERGDFSSRFGRVAIDGAVISGLGVENPARELHLHWLVPARI